MSDRPCSMARMLRLLRPDRSARASRLSPRASRGRRMRSPTAWRTGSLGGLVGTAPSREDSSLRYQEACLAIGEPGQAASQLLRAHKPSASLCALETSCLCVTAPPAPHSFVRWPGRARCSPSACPSARRYPRTRTRPAGLVPDGRTGAFLFLRGIVHDVRQHVLGL